MDLRFVTVLAGVFNVILVFGFILTPMPYSIDPPWHMVPRTGPAVRLDPALGVALPPSAGMLRGTCDIDLPWFRVGFFQIDSALQAKVERDLGRFLPTVDVKPFGGLIDRPLSGYHRQYLGVRLADSGVVVVVNAFISLDAVRWSGKPAHYWLRRFADVCDGAAGFWHVEYDPAGRRFHRFHFGGFA